MKKICSFLMIATLLIFGALQLTVYGDQSYDTDKTVTRNIYDAIAAIANADNPFLNDVLFVDGDRTDDYTANGSLAAPYKTIQAADTASVSGDVIIVAPGTYSETVTLNSGVHLYGWNVAGATLTGEYIIFNGSTINFSGNLVMENGEIIDNSTNGTIAIDGALDVSGGDITLENDETISNSVNGTIALGGAVTTTGAVDFGGDITLENDETISNSSDGTIALGGAMTTTGAVDFGGDITLENDETISNSTNGQIDLGGNVNVMPGTTGGLLLTVQEVTPSITADASITVDLTIPTGSMIVGVQYQVETALADTETWDASFNDGAELWEFADDIAVAQNTEGSAFWPVNTATNITDADTNIVIDGNGAGGAFTAQGVIRFIIYYYDFSAMTDAS